MLRLRLAVVYCPDCGSQLVTHLCVVEAGSELDPRLVVCVFCARDRYRAGQRLRAVVGAWAPEWAPPLAPRPAAELLVGLGATVHGCYVDAETGEPASRAEVLAALAQELAPGHDVEVR
ncbi:MAG: hypothetical protein ACRD2C_08785 [Acidimicrobiales bacterium]